MKEYTENFLAPKEFAPAFANRDVPADKINRFRDHLPDALINNWQEYGWCGYAKGLFWTVDPDEWSGELQSWLGNTPFMERDTYYIIGRSAFGELILWGERSGQSLKIDTSWGAIFPKFDPNSFAQLGPNKSIQLFFSSLRKLGCDKMDEQKKPLFDRVYKKIGELDHNTMYGFAPCLALGGLRNLENLQKVNAHAYMDMLSHVTERQFLRDFSDFEN